VPQAIGVVEVSDHFEPFQEGFPYAVHLFSVRDRGVDDFSGVPSPCGTADRRFFSPIFVIPYVREVFPPIRIAMRGS